MEITKNTAEKMLQLFGENGPVEKCDCLVNIDYHFRGERVIKHYMRVQVHCKSYILKILRLPMCPQVVLEKQAEISQLYRKSGIMTPQCFIALNNTYCAHFQVDETEVVLLLEEDAGEMLNTFSEDIILKMAAFLGKMHRVSLEHGWRFRAGSFYREFSNGNTAYLPLWKTVGTDFLPQDLLKEVICKYEERMSGMKKNWKTLPVATVQGDFYRMNWTVKDGNIMVIDYDRAGDEVLLSDLLITWFRMKYDPVIRHSFPGITDIWKKFIEAYENERVLTEIEKAALEDEYAVIGTVYGTRYFVDLAARGDLEAAVNGLYEILEMLR